MFGTIINVAAILIGGIIGLTRAVSLSPKQERLVQVLLGVFTVFYGLRLTVLNLQGPFSHILKQLGIMILSLMLGRLIGGLLRLQKLSNKLGQKARETFAAGNQKAIAPALGFKMCASLFCAAPLAILGSVGDGLTGYFYPLIIKGIMDGLATMGFATTFRWGPLLSAIPVLAFQGSISLLCKHVVAPYLGTGDLLASVNTVSGILIFSVALVILQIKRITLADYLPSLIVAPLFAWVFR